MRVCLLPLRVRFKALQENFRRLEKALLRLHAFRPDLICLPECTLTGYLWDGVDVRRFAEPIPGPTTERMAQLARHHRAYLCFGLIEREGPSFYNTAVLLDPTGQPVLVHRKIEEHPPYAQGKTVAAVDTAIGRLGILICGDLFHEPAHLVDPELDLLLVPMARAFDGRSPDVRRWEEEERSVYLKAVQAIGVTTALVNALETDTPDAPAFGGAMLVDRKGRLLAESPHGTDEPLLYDLSF